ncbi:hypothetical protein [Trinickia fusca]|uniref:Preprotein translocase subunit SecD n=1 Tax=Trinickia fusca TaxID=2419777 RepID=A0A494XN73_9BURK|nr:hypothetical protein [Trinickia fusca]RKP52127.1 hypothetical protein D7S89_00810 [Trinickia fusca]
MRAEDVLPDNMQEREFRGQTVRKGTIAAFIANAQTIGNPAASEAERATATDDLIASVPSVRAIGVFDVFAIRDPRVQALIDASEAVPAAQG